MNSNRASLWYRRMSVIYAMGAWSVLGSAFFLTRNKKSPGEVEQKDGSATESSESATEKKPESKKMFYMETIVTYRKDFVPVTQRILNYLKSWTGGSGSDP